MISVHELIAVFLQRGTCIESIYLRKEKQRHFCQDTYFRSPPTINRRYLCRIHRSHCLLKSSVDSESNALLTQCRVFIRLEIIRVNLYDNKIPHSHPIFTMRLTPHGLPLVLRNMH